MSTQYRLAGAILLILPIQCIGIYKSIALTDRYDEDYNDDDDDPYGSKSHFAVRGEKGIVILRFFVIKLLETRCLQEILLDLGVGGSLHVCHLSIAFR